MPWQFPHPSQVTIHNHPGTGLCNLFSSESSRQYPSDITGVLRLAMSIVYTNSRRFGRRLCLCFQMKVKRSYCMGPAGWNSGVYFVISRVHFRQHKLHYAATDIRGERVYKGFRISLMRNCCYLRYRSSSNPMVLRTSECKWE